MSDWAFETKQIHAGQNPDSETGARALPIYQTTSFVFDDAQVAADPFAILNVAQAGDHVVASPALYGGTYNLLRYTLPKLGITTTFVSDQADLDEWRAAVRPETKLFFGETISNPDQKVLDIAGIAGVAHDAGVPLFVDNTVATPYLIRPIEHGADVVIHSATKFLGGHGTSIVGALVDAGTFDYAQDPERFPQLNTPSESYHGLVFARDLGVGGLFPVNLSYFLVGLGIETLSLRIERHLANTRRVVEHLQAHPQVERVYYASLDGSPEKERADRYCPLGSGSVFSFDIAGGVEAGRAFVDALELHSHVANIGDVRSLVIHPASTTHSQGSDEDRLGAGVTPGLVRLSVGLEHIDDILADLDRGLEAAAAAGAQA